MSNQITNRQLFFLVFITIIGFSIIELPNAMAISSGTGAWFTLLISSLLFMFPIAVIVTLSNIFHGQTLFQYSPLLVGKRVTSILSLIYLIYFFIVLSMLTRNMTEVIRDSILPKTPTWYIMALILFFCGFAASRGINNMARIMEFFGFFIILVAISIHFTMIFKGDIRNVKPFFEMKEAGRYIEAIPNTFFSFLGFEIMTVVPLTKDNGKKSIMIAMITLLLVGVFYIIIVESTIMIVDIADIQNYKNSIIVAIRRLDIQTLDFLKRLDVFFFVTWLLAVFTTISILLVTISEYFKSIVKFIKEPYVLIIILVSTYVFALLPSTSAEAVKIVTFVTKNLGIIPVFIIPLILLILAKVKKYEI